MIDVQEKKNKIISFLKSIGPSIPVRIAKTIEMDPVFASAILSELLNEKEIKISHMKVGSSPLYFIPGQEKRLEEHVEDLKSAEKEAYIKLKERKVLVDANEEPMIRVALRNLKDFAIPFRFKEKIMWRYTFTTNREIQEIIEQSERKIKEEKPVQKRWEKPLIKKEEKQKPKEKKIEDIFIEKGPEPKFLSEVKEFLKKKNIEFIEEIKTEKKEIIAKVSIRTTLGEIQFLLIAKNKRTTNKEEINSAIQQAIYNNKPCLFIIRKEPTQAIKKIIGENHLIKLEVMKNK